MLFGMIIFPLAGMITSLLQTWFEMIQSKLSVKIAKNSTTIQEIHGGKPPIVLGFTDNDGGPE